MGRAKYFMAKIDYRIQKITYFCTMIKPRVIFLSEGIALLLIFLISTFFLPLNYGIQLTLGLLLAYAIPRIIYSRRSHYSTSGHAVLIVLWFMLSALAVNYVGRCTAWGALPLSEPHLWGDAHRYWSYAEAFYSGSTYTHSRASFGLSLITAVAWLVSGKSIITPVCINICLTISTVVLMGSVTLHLLAHRTSRSAQSVASLAMLASSVLFYWLSHAMQMLKEPLISFGVVLCALALARTIERRHSAPRFAWRDVAVFALGALLVASVRSPYALVMAAGALMCTIYRRPRYSVLAMAACAVMAYCIVYLLSQTLLMRPVHLFLEENNAQLVSQQYIIGASQIPYYNIIGDYFTYPWWKKLLLLPFTSMVQYIIPFPWVFSTPHIDEVFPRLGLGAYIVGGMALFYIFFLSWRRTSRLTAFTAWAILCFVTPAYAVAGSVPRYVTPFQLLFVPMAVYVLVLLLENQHRKNFTIFAVAYAVVLVITLILCYSAQADALSIYA